MADNAITAGLSAFGSVMNLGQNAERFGWEKKNAEAALDLLPTKAAALKSEYEDTIGDNESKAQLRPLDTQNRMKRATMESFGLDSEANRQPIVEQTKDMNANIGLANAQHTASVQPIKNDTATTQANIENQTTSNMFANLADQLHQGNVNGVLSRSAQSDLLFANLGRLLKDGRHDDAKQFANEVIKHKGLFPGTNDLGEVTDIKNTQNGVQFEFANGKPMVVPGSAFTSAMARAQKGDFQAIHTRDNSVYTLDKNTGRVEQKFKGEGNSAMNSEHAPAEVKTAEWLISKGVAKDAGQAWDMVRSAREKTRNAFIMDYVSKNALPGQDSNALAQQAGQVYDSVRTSVSDSQTPTSNNTGDDTLLKKLGLP